MSPGLYSSLAPFSLSNEYFHKNAEHPFSTDANLFRALISSVGISGATDGSLPPSQVPPLFGKLPETPPSAGSTSKRSSSSSSSDSTATVPGPHGQEYPAASAADAISAMQSAARAADTALATIETMWARGEDDPSPATCRAALDACAAGGQWERALSLVRDAALGGAADSEEEESVSGRVEVLALEGRWNEALLLVQGQTGLSDTGGVGVADDGGSGA